MRISLFFFWLCRAASRSSSPPPLAFYGILAGPSVSSSPAPPSPPSRPACSSFVCAPRAPVSGHRPPIGLPIFRGRRRAVIVRRLSIARSLSPCSLCSCILRDRSRRVRAPSNRLNLSANDADSAEQLSSVSSESLASETRRNRRRFTVQVRLEAPLPCAIDRRCKRRRGAALRSPVTSRAAPSAPSAARRAV